jgi:GGDEF domain-containing protein
MFVLSRRGCDRKLPLLLLFSHELQDYELLGRMSGGDLIAIEAKYHLDCITTFRNRYRSLVTKKTEMSDGVNNEKMDEYVAFIELTEYIEGCSESGSHLFKLTDLTSLYVQEILDINKMINKTRLKNALLEHFKGSLQEQTDGRNTVLVFREGISDLLKDALKRRDFSEDAEILAKAACIVRKDMFLNEGFNFRGCFPMNCQ